MARRYPGPYEGVFLALGAAAIGVALYEATHARWLPLAVALAFAAAAFAAGAWSHRLARRRRRF